MKRKKSETKTLTYLNPDRDLITLRIRKCKASAREIEIEAQRFSFAVHWQGKIVVVEHEHGTHTEYDSFEDMEYDVPLELSERIRSAVE